MTTRRFSCPSAQTDILEAPLDYAGGQKLRIGLGTVMEQARVLVRICTDKWMLL